MRVIFHKFKLFIVQNWILTKIIFISKTCFEDIQNNTKSEGSTLEKFSDSIYLVDGK